MFRIPLARDWHHSRIARLVVSALLLAAPPLFAGVPAGFEGRLLPIDSGQHGQGDLFGSSVAVSGVRAFVGAPEQGHAGTVTAFDRSGSWTETEVLAPADLPAGSAFGHSVAMAGSFALVGAPFESTDGDEAGAVYLFERVGGSWIERSRLSPADAEPAKRFGWSVAMTSTRAVIGATGDDQGGPFAGAVYVFEPQGANWTETAKLVPGDAESNEVFGFSVDVDGDFLVAGARFDDEAAPNAGAAYVYESVADLWVLRSKLTASDAQAGDEFGRATAIAGDRVVVGSPFDDDGGSRSGAVYVFEQDGNDWDQLQKLVRSGAAAGDRFGMAVSITESRLAVGAPGASSDGVVVAYARSGDLFGTAVGLDAGAGVAGRDLGMAVAVDGDNLLAGAPADGGLGPDAGAAFAYRFSGGAWGADGVLRGAPGLTEGRAGSAIAVDGSRLLVGAPGSGAGEAQLFVDAGAGFVRVQTLQAVGGLPGDGFGFSVDIDGVFAAIGAPGRDGSGEDLGSVYLFMDDGGGWTPFQRIDSPTQNDDDAFGHAVALEGNELLVGATGDSGGGAFSGIVHRFQFDGLDWVPAGSLAPGDRTGLQAFGFALAIDGADLVVGAPFDPGGGVFAGAAYVFERVGNSWTERQKLLAGDADNPGGFGQSLAIAGDRIVVGEPFDDALSSVAGSAFLFERSGSTWSQTAKIVPPLDGQAGLFGTSVAVLANRILIGEPDRGSGTLHSYELPLGSGPETLADPDARPGDLAGTAAAIGAGRAIFGVPGADDVGRNSGGAILFTLPDNAPVTGDDTYQVDEDQLLNVIDPDGSLTVSAGDDGVLANDADPEGSALSVLEAGGEAPGVAFASEAGGVVTLQADGTFDYQAPDDFFGDDGFSYRASDGSSSTPADVSITVLPVPDAPSVDPGQGADVLENPGGFDLVLTLTGTDPDDEPLGDWLITSGNVGIDGDAQAPFALDADTGALTIADLDDFDFETRDRYTLTVRVTDSSEGALLSEVVDVVINVLDRAESPRPTADDYDAAIGEVLEVPAGSGLLANDADPDGQALTVVAVDDLAVVGSAYEPPGGGSLTVAADGSLSFDPGSDFDDLGSGEARTVIVGYTVSDGGLEVDSQVAIRVVNPQGEADLVMTVAEADAVVEPGERFMASFLVRNDGPDAVEDATVSVPVPDGSTDASWSCGADAGGGSCGAADGVGAIVVSVDLPVGGSVRLSFEAEATRVSGRIEVEANVAVPGSMTDPMPVSNSVSASVAVGDTLISDGFED